MNHLYEIQGWLNSTGRSGLVVPTSDEFLSEFAPAANRRLRWATGFRGSTATAVVLQDAAALFLDGRYFEQGVAETRGVAISVEPATLPSRRAWLKRSLGAQARIALDPWLHSSPDVGQWRSLAEELGFEIELLTDNPIDGLWAVDRPSPHAPSIVDYPVHYAGETYQTKCAELVTRINAAGLRALLIADPEDVSWLLNVRAASEALRTNVGDWHVVPSCTSRLLVQSDGRIVWFVDEDRVTPEIRARSSDQVVLALPETLPAVLREVSRQGPVGTDLRRTPAALVAIIEEQGRAHANDSVARRRWRKNETELRHARQAHITDAAAVVKFMAWLARTVPKRTVYELEAAQVLETFRSENSEYKGASMPLMSASGPSGACPHYVPHTGSNRALNDHPIYWMDSGGQYYGGTTDNTITLAVGTPEDKHVLAHTLVLQGFIALATACVPVGTYALHLDTIARQPLWREGMNFAHGVGHGVGSYLNIHEGPHIGREPGPTTAVPVETGMILSNEPGYYEWSDFGVRVESHLAVIESRHAGFLEFETLSRLPIDPSLVDFERLSRVERAWLATYHRTVLQDVEPLLDASTATWLRTVVQTFVQAERDG